MVTVSVPTQPFISVTVTGKIPAVRLVATCPVAPPGQDMEKGPFPLLICTEAEPPDPPAHRTLVSTLAVTAGPPALAMEMEVEDVQPFASVMVTL
jgi:hypothetical protein